MRLAISNLAWPHEADHAVAELLQRLSVPAIEVAPTKVWPKPLEASFHEVNEFRRFWARHGIRIVALQSLLFGRSDLQLFADEMTQSALLAHLGGMCRLAADLGGRVLVFGSPKNRSRGGLSEAAALPVARDFFRRLGDAAFCFGVTIGVEPNPPVYGCDFLTSGVAAAEFVREVNHPAIRLHLDTACLALAGESPEPLLRNHAARICHFHISEPKLEPIHHDTLNHALLGAFVRQAGYAGWLSIEMQPAAGSFVVDVLEQSLQFVRSCYLAAASAKAA